MIPFNLEQAIAGKTLITRDGRSVPQFFHITARLNDPTPIIAIIEGNTHKLNINGRASDFFDSNEDLFMAPEKKSIWVNIYYLKDSLSIGHYRDTTYENAVENITNRETYIKTIEITNDLVSL
jgi:hypothetical protein